jgi:uncharacterized Zn finger protein
VKALTALTESDIRRLATSQSLRHGEKYYASGAVFDLQRRDKILTARVVGSQVEPYRVTITLGHPELRTRIVPVRKTGVDAIRPLE